MSTNRLRLIPASSADTPWLEQLRRSVYQDLFRATWGGWDEARHARHFAACIALGNISLVESDGAPVGMVQLLDGPDTVDVAEIQVQPSHQNRGIGSRILADVIAAAHRGGKHVGLKLGRKNDGALRLYQRLGFRLVETSETHHHMICEAPRP